jgi:hypothetical protein
MKFIQLFMCFLFCASLIYADPQPGDVFREYTWWNTNGDAGGALRVGGREGTTNWNTKIVNGYWETVWLDPGHDIDLEHAIKAEVNLEKILCHDGTRGLSFQINDGDWIVVPEADNIPTPQHQYQHHIYPNVKIPLDILNQGTNNKFKIRVSAEHTWNWPQNLIYGFHIRVYYDPANKAHPAGAFTSIQNGDVLGKNVNLEIEASSPYGDIAQVDFIGLYEDINWEGDGVYRQWHYHFFHGGITHHIGSDMSAPFNKTWQTDWLPDQAEAMQIAARVKDETGIITFIEPVKELSLDRRDFSVELCKPYNVPQKWVTRSGEKTENVRIQGDLSQAVAYQLCWASWSPGYMNGLYVNDKKVFDKEGPDYQYYSHRVQIENPAALVAGVNKIKTGKTPLYDGQMVHGMEVEWPGIMLLVKYDKTIETSVIENSEPPKSALLFENYPNPFNGSTRIHYELPENDNVELSIRNAIGQKITTLIDENQPAGNHHVAWSGLDEHGQTLGSGLYFLSLETSRSFQTRKVLLLQ